MTKNELKSLIKECIINELTLAKLNSKQHSITNLFPSWSYHKNKVGNITISNINPSRIQFKVRSTTKSGISYNCFIQFNNISVIIKKALSDSNILRNRKLDLNKLSDYVLTNTDFSIRCDCPAALYYGSNYILSKNKSIYGTTETRPPRIRNPRQHGIYCKHLDVVLEKLPKYIPEFLKHHPFVEPYL